MNNRPIAVTANLTLHPPAIHVTRIGGRHICGGDRFAAHGSHWCRFALAVRGIFLLLIGAKFVLFFFISSRVYICIKDHNWFTMTTPRLCMQPWNSRFETIDATVIVKLHQILMR